MPLTEPQKVAVKRHLGYHSAPQSRYPLVEGFFAVEDVLTSLGDEAVDEAVAILDRLAALEAQLDTAPSRMKAGSVGSIALNSREVDQLWREVRRWRAELSTLVGVPMQGGGCSVLVV